MSGSEWPATSAALEVAPALEREVVRQLAAGLVDAGKDDTEIAAAVTRWTTPPAPAVPDPLAEHRLGVAVVLHQAIVPASWTAPADRDYPSLSTEREMAEAAAVLLAAGERPWRVVRSLARTWPEWCRLLPELVRAVVEDAQRARRAAQ